MLPSRPGKLARLVCQLLRWNVGRHSEWAIGIKAMLHGWDFPRRSFIATAHAYRRLYFVGRRTFRRMPRTVAITRHFLQQKQLLRLIDSKSSKHRCGRRLISILAMAFQVSAITLRSVTDGRQRARPKWFPSVIRPSPAPLHGVLTAEKWSVGLRRLLPVHFHVSVRDERHFPTDLSPDIVWV